MLTGPSRWGGGGGGGGGGGEDADKAQTCQVTLFHQITHSHTHTQRCPPQDECMGGERGHRLNFSPACSYCTYVAICNPSLLLNSQCTKYFACGQGVLHLFASVAM